MNMHKLDSETELNVREAKGVVDYLFTSDMELKRVQLAGAIRQQRILTGKLPPPSAREAMKLALTQFFAEQERLFGAMLDREMP